MIDQSSVMAAAWGLNGPSQLGTTISCIFVVASAIYVARQVKAAKDNIRSAAMSSVLEQSANRYFQNANSHFAPRVLMTAYGSRRQFASSKEALAEFEDEDKYRCMAFFVGLFAALENQHQQLQVLGEHFREPFKHRLELHFRSTIVQAIWKEDWIQLQYTESFRECVTKVIEAIQQEQASCGLAPSEQLAA